MSHGKMWEVLALRILSVICVVLPSVASAQTAEAEPIRTTVCELNQTPEKFNGKIVQVRATFVYRMEWSGLRDDACGAYLLQGENGFPGLSGRKGEYAFIESPLDVDHPRKLNWNPIHLPPPIRRNKDEQYRQFESYVEERFKPKDGSFCFACPLFEITP